VLPSSPAAALDIYLSASFVPSKETEQPSGTLKITPEVTKSAGTTFQLSKNKNFLSFCFIRLSCSCCGVASSCVVNSTVTVSLSPLLLLSEVSVEASTLLVSVSFIL